MYNYIKQNSSKMNHKITFYKREQSTTKDEIGQYPMVETMVCKVWASIVPAGGSAVTTYAETIKAQTTHKITIRVRGDITADMWIVDDTGKRYDITYVTNRFDKAEVLEIMAVEQYGGG